MNTIPIRAPFFCLVVAATLGTGGIATAAPQATIQERQVIVGEPSQVPFPGFPGQRAQKTGTARVLGRVTSPEGTALRRAQVRIMGQEIAAKIALTDAQGRYEFRDLPAGRFTLSASKSGYVNVQYGQTRPFESGKTIEIADKQALGNINIIMPRGGVISGRVVDEFGEPVADALVSSMRQTWSGGRRRITPAGRTAQTNDLGQFRLYGLAPGEYYVSATVRGADMLMLDMLGSSAGPSGSGSSSGYAPTYFPGTASPADAQRITVAAAQEVGGTDFALLPVRLAKVSGSVVRSDGKPLAGAMVNLVPSSRGADIPPLMMGNSARTSNDGTFTISGVMPGDYTLQVRTMIIVTSAGEGAGNTMMFASRAAEGDDPEFGALPLSVAGEDLPNVVVVTSKGGTATGRLSFEGVARPDAVGMFRVIAPSADAEGPMAAIGARSAAMKADGSFELKGLGGPRLIRVASLPSGMMLKAVHLNGNDVTDTPVDFKAGEQVSGLEVVIGKATEVNGTVTDSKGAPVKDYTAIVFAEDSQRWSIPMTRWVAGTRPDQDGRFRLSNLPAGSYYAIAVDYVAQGEWGDPDLLERLRAKATRVTIEDGESKSLDLKLSEI